MSWWNDFIDGAKKKLNQFNNSTFRDGTMAVCALVAAADGSIDKSEKTKVAKLIQGNELLSCFDPIEMRDLFLKYCDIATDEFKRIDLFNIVRRLKGNDEQAETCVKVALIIANADGDFADCEKEVVRDLCQTLAIPAASVGL
jgi:tellurite resistance protein TerB